MIRLTYLDRISPYGVLLRDVGRIHSPYLGDVLKLGYNQYQRILTLFLYTPKKYFEDVSKEAGIENIWETFSEEQQSSLSMFDILTTDETVRSELISGLAVFISGELE